MTFSPVILLQEAGVAGLVLAAATDLKARIIPNGLVLWVLGAGGAARVLADGVPAWISIVVAFLVFTILAFLARREFLGGGDAKLIAASTLLVEPSKTPELVVAIILAGGVLACGWSVLLIVQRTIARRKSTVQAPTASSSVPTSTGPPTTVANGQMPYAVAILAGVAATLLRLA